MEQVTDKATLIANLRRLNPRYSIADIVIYVDAVAEYRAAQANIDEHGTIVMHPRTGAPITNPYMAVRDAAGKLIAKHPRLVTGGLWEPAVPVPPAPAPAAPRRKR